MYRGGNQKYMGPGGGRKVGRHWRVSKHYTLGNYRES